MSEGIAESLYSNVRTGSQRRGIGSGPTGGNRSMDRSENDGKFGVRGGGDVTGW